MAEGTHAARSGERDELDRGRLGTYLNDHLAGATLGARVARRSADANSNTEYGRALRWLADEIDEDRRVLKQVLAALELPENPFKKLTGVLLERAGALKPNGRITSYSPLSRLLELEGLMVGAMGKRCLWQTLEVVAALEPALDDFDFAELQARAGRHVSRLGQLRLDARLPAFQRPLSAGPQGHRGAWSRTQTSHTTHGSDRPESAPRPGESPVSYLGEERRSGAERRQRLIFTSAAADRRSGAERRGHTASSH